MGVKLEILLSTACCALVVSLTSATATAQGPAPEPSAAPPSSVAPSSPLDPHNEARAHFEEGNRLFKEGALTAALDEFVQSKKLHATKSATSNAALCLMRLRRFDEALDMYEALLRDFSDLPDDLKLQAQREVVRLRGLMGTIDISGAEPGAAITIDQRSRGEFPALVPLRVPAGNHLVRITKEWFEPFETRVEVAGGQTMHVAARLHALARSGRLRVVERGGKTIDVVVDGGVVGKTPFDGLLGAGDHMVLLRGEGELGTPPALVHIQQNEVTPLTLSAQHLGAGIRVEPVPVDASVAIDGVPLGRGTWEVNLPEGMHTIEVAAPGFISSVKQVKLWRDELSVQPIALEPNLSSPLWPKSLRWRRFTAELVSAATLLPTFGGDIAGKCTAPCDLALGLGGYDIIRGGVELGDGLGIGITAGYLTATQASIHRKMSLLTVGLGADEGLADDLLKLHGAIVGAWVGHTLGDRVRVHLRLGAGALIGSIHDGRTGTFTASGKSVRPGVDVYSVGQVSQEHPVRFFYVAPELRVGRRLSPHVELNLGLEIPIFIPSYQPTWNGHHPINAGKDGYATFASEALLGRVLVSFAPGMGARYDF